MFDSARFHRPLFQRPHHAATQLFLGKRLAAAVGLDDSRRLDFRGFVSIEARTAGFALAAASDLHAVTGQSGIDDPRVFMAAKRTIQGVSLPFFRLRRKPASLNGIQEFASGLRQPQT